MKWEITYSNDVGPDDDFFREWWDVSNGNVSFRSDSLEGAEWLCSLLNGKDGEHNDIEAGGVVGLCLYVSPSDGRKDKFEAKEDGFYHFPCCSCRHARTKESEFCQGCVHYVL